MSLLNISGVKKFYGQQDVLRGVSFHINAGERTGLIGANGAGKTTLIRIILGQVNPDEGQVNRAKGLRLGHLPQDLLSFSGQTLLELVMDTAEEIRNIETELDYLAQDIEEAARQDPRDEEALLELTSHQSRLLNLFENLGGYTLESEAQKILQGLGFFEDDFNRPIDEFSGGWMMRAVLARLLLARPDILLLDEPTNHLDMESLLWLETYLLFCPSALILVSHDRVFLNNVINRVVEVDRGEVYSYTGNYDRYLEEREKRLTTEAATYAGHQERVKQVEKFIERNRVRKDRAKQVQSRIKMLNRMEKVEAPVQAGKSFRLSLPPAGRAPEILCQLSGVTKAYGDHTVYRNLDFTVRRNDRIAFLGANGHGKSTLMKLLAGTTEYQDGERRIGEGVVMSYFAQFQLEELDPNRTVLEELDTVAGDLTPGRLRTVLGGFLFRGDDVFKKVAVLSGGEKTRLILAKIMMVGPNLMLLDEPSNHLDIPGRIMLEQALRQYTGTLCLISHDRHLINAVANQALIIDQGRVETFPGNFDDYMRIWHDRLQQEAAARETETTAPVDNKSQAKGLTRAEKEARKKAAAQARQKLYTQRAPLLAEIEGTEKRQGELSAELERLTTILAAPETYQDSKLFNKLNQEYNQVKEEMDRVTAAWEQASLKLEELEAEAEETD